MLDDLLRRILLLEADEQTYRVELSFAPEVGQEFQVRAILPHRFGKRYGIFQAPTNDRVVALVVIMTQLEYVLK